MSDSILDQLVAQWEQDAVIDKSDISGEILRTPNLFAKYLRILASWKQKRTATQIKLNEMKQLVSRYYNGELSVQQCRDLLGYEQFQGTKPIRAVLDQMVNADPAVTRIVSQLEMIDNMIYASEQILNSIKSRDFMLGNYTKYQMFIAGAK